MRHVHLTCKNHPNLRWSCKEIAWSNGKYNGARSIFFLGTVDEQHDPHPPNMVLECKCPASDLIEAPEQESQTK